MSKGGEYSFMNDSIDSTLTHNTSEHGLLVEYKTRTFGDHLKAIPMIQNKVLGTLNILLSMYLIRKKDFSIKNETLTVKHTNRKNIIWNTYHF